MGEGDVRDQLAAEMLRGSTESPENCEWPTAIRAGAVDETHAHFPYSSPGTSSQYRLSQRVTQKPIPLQSELHHVRLHIAADNGGERQVADGWERRQSSPVKFEPDRLERSGLSRTGSGEYVVSPGVGGPGAGVRWQSGEAGSSVARCGVRPWVACFGLLILRSTGSHGVAAVVLQEE
jgi:hypothetical protein